MPAKFSPPKKETYTQIGIRVPTKMITAIGDKLKEGGYNSKQRSLWVREALDMLLARPDYANLVAEEFIMPGTTKQIPLNFTKDQLETGIINAIDLVKTEEGVETDRSAVIRTAIIQRILADQNEQLMPIGIPSQQELI